MDSALTVAAVRAKYESLASSSSAFISELNEVTERLMGSDIWVGCSTEVLFPASAEGYFVLPRQFISVLGYNFNNVPKSVFGRFHQFIECGIGWQDQSIMTMDGLIEDGFMVTQKETSGTFYLRVKPSEAADNNKEIRFFGLDDQSVPQPIYTAAAEGIQLIIQVPQATTIQKFTAVTGIQAPANMRGSWTLWQVDTTTGVETQIGQYYPGETVPRYHKYKIGVRTTNDVIRCFCRRQWIELVNETDFVFPGNLAAIKLGFKALQLEDANKISSDSEPNADDMWAKSEQELDKELAVVRGYEIPSLRMFSGPYPRFNQIVN